MVDNRTTQQHFRIQDMAVIYDQSHGAVDVVHRHDYFTVLLIERARGRHMVDYNAFAFGASEVHFVSPGQVHQVALTQRPAGHVITFSKDFLVRNNIPVSFISNINLFRAFGHTPPLQVDAPTLAKLRNVVTEMQACTATDQQYGDRAAGALLQLFLIYCNNSSTLDQSQLDERSAGVCIVRDFKALVENKYAEWHQVKSYAAEIHISPKHLSQSIKELTGKVAKAHIQDRIVLEAKRLLLHTTLPVKEIAYRVGFEEPLHFSSFFKKQAGASPSHFRKVRVG